REQEPCPRGHGRPEGAVAVAGSNADRVIGIADGRVQFAVAIEVRHGKALGPLWGELAVQEAAQIDVGQRAGADGVLKGAVAIAKVYDQIGAVEIGGQSNQIELAVAVDVPGDELLDQDDRRDVRDLRAERTVAVTE